MEKTMSQVLWLLVVCILPAKLNAIALQEDYSPYWIVIDGGSTGSRLHVLEFVETAVDDGETTWTELDCVRRGSSRANYPLSAFGRTDPSTQRINASAVADHLMPAFVYAAEQIPPEYHTTTTVLYQATAGMRLLPESEQQAVYDAMYEGLLQNEQFVFRGMKRSDIATLSGEDEGFYGAVAANYLQGTIDAHLQMIPLEDETHGASADAQEHFPNHRGPIGALDMGGSSTQIVFLPGATHQDVEEQACANTLDDSAVTNQDCHMARQDEMPSKLNGQDFFATSYLSYGVDQFRERLWNTLVKEHVSNLPDDACDAQVLENPCNFKGYTMEWMGYTMVGTGNAQECVGQVQRLIPHHEEVDHHGHRLGSHVGGVAHPPVRGKFFAMSLYFFTLDALRELSEAEPEAHKAINLSWPTPSIAELSNALHGLCQRSWQGDLEDIQHNAHSFTRAEVLPFRCLESVYMVTLLKDGFGFAPESRDITFAFLVDGSEVEWSLGMALSLRAQQRQEFVPTERKEDTKSNVTGNPERPTSTAANSNFFQALSNEMFSS